MHTILFRGGMCGDLIATMLDPTIVKPRVVNRQTTDSVVLNDVIKPSRERLKSFWRLTDQQKYDYLRRLSPFDITIVSHDTDTAILYTEMRIKTIALACSDESLLLRFANRFSTMHPATVISDVAGIISVKSDFVAEYAYNLAQWQKRLSYYNIKKFDVSNIFSPSFIDDFIAFDWHSEYDTERAKDIHTRWLEKELVLNTPIT